LRRAARELGAIAAVRSPYVIAPYDAGQQDGGQGCHGGVPACPSHAVLLSPRFTVAR